jgi:AcrR family transcriptional regulator
MRNRLLPDKRKDQILLAAIQLAECNGLADIDAVSVAAGAGCAVSLVRHYFGTPDMLRRSIVVKAVQQRRIPVIAMALAMRVERPEIPYELTQEAAEWVAAGGLSNVG